MPFCSDAMYFKDPKVLFDDIVKYNKSDKALKIGFYIICMRF